MNNFNNLKNPNQLETIKINNSINEKMNIDIINDTKLFIYDFGYNHKIDLSFFVKENKNLEIKYFCFAKNKNYININIDLEEKKASADFKLITIATQTTDNKIEVKINNLAPETKGNIWQKGVVKNQGKNQFLATGFIKKGSDEASNFQESRVLLLDDAAKGDASPILLIDHYNVLAGHAASVSRVNSDELYYLQSRGISKQDAENLMTIAFIKPLIDETDEKTQNKLMDLIESLLYE